MIRATREDIDCMICLFRHEAESKYISKMQKYRKQEIGKDIFFPIYENFEEISLEDIDAKYFFEFHPQKIFRDRSNHCDLLFQITQQYPKELMKTLEMVKSALKTNDNEIIFYEEEMRKSEEIELAWYEYKSFAESEMVYNLNFFVDVRDIRVFGAFNCPFEEYDKWKTVVMKMLDDIQIGEGENERILGRD